MFRVRVQQEPIVLAAESGSGRDDCGARVRFVGTVRNDARSAPLSHLMLEHFPGVTEAEIERIITLACERWALQSAQVVHRVGRINVGEDIVVVETASAHRRDAYEANVFIMDYLKTQAPFWKQECFADGTEDWVEAKHSDEQAAQRWVVRDATARPRRIGALILAGGEGRRMGHRNKGLVPFRGRPMARHVLEALRPHVAYLAISANRDLPDYEALGVPVFPDEPHYRMQGPLAGIASALPRFPAWLDAILVTPCDLPLLPPDLVHCLARALADERIDCAIATTPGNEHHGVFLFRPGMLLSLLPQLLDGGDKRLQRWLQANACVPVAFEDARAFSNINDLETLHALEG